MTVITRNRPTTVRRNRPQEEAIAQKKTKPVFKMKKIALKKSIFWGLGALALIAIVSVAANFQDHITCSDIQVHIHSLDNSKLLNVKQVKEIIGLEYEQDIVGQKMNEIKLQEIEEALEANPFIHQAEVYKNLKGVLNVEVDLRKPIARVYGGHGSFYLDLEGRKIPRSHVSTPNLPLVRGTFYEDLYPVDTLGEKLVRLMPVLSFIDRDPFWKAQVSEVELKKNGDIILHPEVGNLRMELGDVRNLDNKFKRLRNFLHQVSNTIGWETYKSISVKYKGQVVGRK